MIQPNVRIVDVVVGVVVIVGIGVTIGVVTIGNTGAGAKFG